MKKIILDDEDRDKLLESLKNPPPPNKKLIEAFKFYEKQRNSKNSVSRNYVCSIGFTAKS